MKRYLAILILLATTSAPAQGPPYITNYFTEAVVVDSSFTNAGDTGMTTGRLYVAISINETTNGTYTAALQTNSVAYFAANLSRFLESKLATNAITDFDIETTTQYTPTTSNVIYKTTSRVMTEDDTYLLTEP